MNAYVDPRRVRGKGTLDVILVWVKLAASRSTAAFLACALFLLGVLPVRSVSQEITYDSVPRKILGPELWSVPVGGHLTLSRDGTKLLVASVEDTTFYVVDAVGGKILRRLPAAFWSTGIRTFYMADDDLSVLCVNGQDSTRTLDGLVVIDINTGDVILERYPGNSLQAVSKVHDRLVSNRQFIELSTYRLIKEFDDGGLAWFDDERGLLYRTRPQQVQEIDAVTGEILRTTGTAASRSVVRRPKNSDWIYVFAMQIDGFSPYNYVEAIHLETGERVKFTKNIARETRALGTTPSQAYGSGYLQLSKQPQVLWTYHAESRRSEIIANPIFEFFGQVSTKEFVYDASRESYIHSWFGGGDTTRCNLLIDDPALSVNEDSEPTQPWLTVTSSELVIHVNPSEIVHSVTITDMAGRIVMSMHEGLHHVPLRFPISHVPSGACVCAVEVAGQVLSSSFTIMR
jgi:hypothetical protein